ncbi:histidinol-phosphate transaminase [Clostridium sp. KNHs216]|uniref:histidinol-phosphate transaminase n=1 Tax=Clostridium sp. KNHs216 TaxID=1550235 RepID=UPI0011548EE5|nr:histidinol-phosphate transaminase [Clostridium sp. KNHs216]TQI65764.1 histidinol-phosphate aminotransferase [Clostridium sp. KNHs216]
MAYQLNEKIRDLRPYDPITGSYPIRLDANESFLPIPNRIALKIMESAAFTAYNRYPDPMASELCESFAEFYQVNPAHVTAGNGSDELISVICGAFLMKGDAMLTVSPDFSMYRFYASIVEAKSIVYAKNPDLTIDVDKVIELANANDVKLILFSNPCNPTSLGLSKEEVRRLITSVKALVVLDEAYMDFWDQSLLGEVEQYDNLMILRTCSKAFGMAAIRLGFAVANPTLTNALKAVKSPYNVNLLTQKIGSLILKEPDLVHSGIDNIVASRNMLYSEMVHIEKNNSEKMHVYPTATNFVFLQIAQAEEIFLALLKSGIAVRFMGDFLRVTAGTMEENKEFIKVFETVIQ